MVKRSAGLLMWRRHDSRVEVLLVHPGGPFFVSKDTGVWSIPKGEYEPDEAPLEAARREFEEETGFRAAGDFQPLGETRLKSGKVILVWAFEGDADVGRLRSNHFSMEWPPNSGKQGEFPEVDRAEWFSFDAARKKIHPAQVFFLDRLEQALNAKYERHDQPHSRSGGANSAAGASDSDSDMPELRPRSGSAGAP